MRIWTRVDDVLQAQRGHLFPWLPVFFACGIGVNLSLADDPPWVAYIAVLMLALGFSWIARARSAVGILALAGLSLCLGMLHMAWRTHLVAAPVLQYRYYGAVEGQVRALDRAASGNWRMTLSEVRLPGEAPEITPHVVRITLLNAQQVRPGDHVMTTAHLSPPQGPVEPGGFDFRRHAWFQQLGAVGYSRNPVLRFAPRDTTGLTKLRSRMAQWISQHLPPRVSGVGIALMSGMRGFVPPAVTEQLRTTNLAHLLAISGLHMGLLSAVVFGGLRRALALVPYIALRFDTKKLAAAAALMVAFGYLLLSGAAIATERAFVMVAVMLVAILFDRRALSLRALSVAALIILIRRPESLASPGFQMSFAATMALVAVFRAYSDWFRGRGRPSGLLYWVLSLFLSSLTAGLATAPISAAHFNVFSSYGLVANLLAVPMMGLCVMPGAVLAVLLAPIGLEVFGFSVMSLGLNWILSVAEQVAQLPDARRAVVSPGTYLLPVYALAGCWLVLWQGRLRWVAVPILLAAFLWWEDGSQRPAVLIAADGGIVGVMTENGRALSRGAGKSFVARVWLENDGDAATQQIAATRWAADTRAPKQTITALGRRWVHLRGKRGIALLEGCEPSDVIITSVNTEIAGECLVITPEFLSQVGSIAFDNQGTMRTSRETGARRAWSR